MKLSTTIPDQFYATFGIEKSIEVLAEIGFDALDMNLIGTIFREEFSDDRLEATCLSLRRLAESCGVSFNQAHAPFPSFIFKSRGNETPGAYNARVKPKILSAIRAAGILGAGQIVVHPISVPDKREQKQFNLDYYNSLAPTAKEYGVKIALENMWGTSRTDPGKIVANVCSLSYDLADYFDALDPSVFTVCLDVGHSGLVGETAEDAIRVLGHDRLHALHVHDNDHLRDLHTIPYLGKLNWENVTKALADIRYDGDFTFEVCGTYCAPFEGKPDLLRKSFELVELVGRDLISRIEAAGAAQV